MDKVEKLSADEVKSLEDRVTVPYRVEDVTVLSEGEWNGLQWTASELREAVENTDFGLSQNRGDRQPPNSSLFFDHEDRSADDWIGRVENVRMEGKDVKSDLVITDKQLAMNLEFGAPFGVSPKADGLVDDQHKMQDFEFENFSMVVNPAVKTTWLNEDIESVLQDMEIHDVKFRSTTEGEWDSPNLEDFTDKSWDDMSRSEKQAVGRHFLISKTGFPAENYTDFALPVVQPNGALNLNALQNAKSRVGQVSGIDDSEIARVSRMINNLANGNFDSADFSEVDMSGHKDEEEDMSQHEMEDGEGSVEDDDETNNSNEDTKVKTSMAQEQETEQEPEAEDSAPEGEEESVENSEDFVTADQLSDFKSEVVDELKQELADGDDDEEAEDDGNDVEEAEASDNELSEFEEFRQENPNMSLSEAAEEFEEQSKDVDTKIEEMTQKFEDKISDLESKLESKEEEVEELSEKVSNPQRATQVDGGDGDDEDLSEKVSELSDEELHAAIFKQMDAQNGVRATKEMMYND